MNEEIDVSGCVYYNSQNDTGKWCDLTCERDDAPAFRCEQIKNCVYKQMKRLEAENAKLKDEINKVRQLLNEYCMDCDIDEYSNTYEKCDDCIATDIGKIIGERAKDE